MMMINLRYSISMNELMLVVEKKCMLLDLD